MVRWDCDLYLFSTVINYHQYKEYFAESDNDQQEQTSVCDRNLLVVGSGKLSWKTTRRSPVVPELFNNAKDGGTTEDCTVSSISSAGLDKKPLLATANSYSCSSSCCGLDFSDIPGDTADKPFSAYIVRRS